MADEITDGDWVQVWGLVKKADGPDSMLIRFESRGEHYEGWVKDAHITKPDRLPEWAGRCTHLLRLPKGKLLQCERHAEHGGIHEGGTEMWDDEGTYGYLEEK